MTELINLIKKITKLNSQTISSVNSIYNGIVKADVNCQEIDNSSFIFLEHGIWQQITEKSESYSNKNHIKTIDKIKEFTIQNSYLWNISDDKIKLSHLRNGYDNPVFLLNLVKKSENHWQTEQSHSCGQDIYYAELSVLDNKINLKWQIKGPKKDEIIDSIYS